MNKSEFIGHVQDLTGLSEENSENGTAIVLSILSNRLTQGESDDAKAQLSEGMKQLWQSEKALNLFQKIFNQQLKYRDKIEFYSLVDEKLQDEKIEIGAGKLVEAVFHTLKHQLSEGEIEDISNNLPQEIREVWEGA